MAHKRGFGQIRRLPSKRYQARCTGPDLGLHNGPYTFARKEDAEAWLVAERRLISDGGWTPPAARKAAMVEASAQAAEPPLTVGAYVERIIVRRATRSRRPIAPTTVDTYRKDWRLRSGRLHDLPLSELTPAVVAQWWDGLSSKSATSNGRCYDLLKSVMAEAVEDELIDRNPCRIRGAGKPASRRQGEALDIPEILAYLQAVPEHYRVALSVAVWCGLRSGEVRALRACDIDLDARLVHVTRSVTRVRREDDPTQWQWRFAAPKTRAGVRSVAMPAVLVTPLRQWLDRPEVTSAKSLIFPGSDGKSPMSGSTLHDAHAKGRTAIGKPDLTVHDLRRTAATLAAQGGATIAELMRLLGHTTAQMAMVYQVATDARDLERAKRLDTSIASVT